MPAVFGPYKRDSTLLRGAGQFKHEEGYRNNGEKASGKRKEVLYVVHTPLAYTKRKTAPKGGVSFRRSIDYFPLTIARVLGPKNPAAGVMPLAFWYAASAA